MFSFMNHNELSVISEVDKSAEPVSNIDENRSDSSKIGTQVRDLGIWSPAVRDDVNGHSDYVNCDQNSALETKEIKHDNLQSSGDAAEPDSVNSCTEDNEEMGLDVADKQIDDNIAGVQRGLTSERPGFLQPKPRLATYFHVSIKPLILKSSSVSLFRNVGKFLSCFLSRPIQNLKPDSGLEVEDVTEHVDGLDVKLSEGITNMLPVTLDSVHFRDATVMLLAYGDREVREMENVNGVVKFQNHHSHIHVEFGGNCKAWRSDMMSKDGGWLSANVFVDIIEQKWHDNLKIENLFVPVHLCTSRGETFPNFHGQLDVTGLEFDLLDAPSPFSKMSVSLCFRGQRIFLHNANDWFGSIPLEASGDFGIHPEEGEFHLMCQVPSVEVNSLMRTFKMRPLLFPVAGSVAALFNCQGPLDAPVFVGSAMVSRTFSQLHVDTPTCAAFEILAKSKEAGALEAFDRVPF